MKLSYLIKGLPGHPLHPPLLTRRPLAVLCYVRPLAGNRRPVPIMLG